MKRLALRRAPVLIVLVAAAAQLLAVCAPLTSADAQSARSNASAPFEGGARRPKPTVESASREAQAEIRACDNREALLCVAGALSRYAAALQEVAERRRLQTRPASHIMQ